MSVAAPLSKSIATTIRGIPSKNIPASIQSVPTIAVIVTAMLFLGVFAQEAALVYQHVMYRALEATPDVTYRGAILLTPLAVLICFTLGDHPCMKLPQGFGLMIGLFLVSSVMSVAMSSIMCLETKYLIGDSLRFVGPWLTLFISYQSFRVIRQHAGTGALIVWYDRLAYLAIFDALVTIGFGQAFFGWHISNWFYIFLVGWVILSERHSDLTTNFLIAVVLYATAVSQKRTNFVIVFVALILAVFLRILYGRHIFRLCLTIAGLLLAALLAQAALTYFTGQESLIDVYVRIFQGISVIVIEGEVDNSYGYRINEVLNIQSFFSQSPWKLGFGVGFGGEIPMLYDTGPQAATSHGNMHHAHKGYWIYLLRNGCCGLLLLATFAWQASVGLIKSRSSAPLITASCAVYAVTRLVGSFGGNLMLEDFDLPLVVGLGFAFVDFDSLPAGGRSA